MRLTTAITRTVIGMSEDGSDRIDGVEIDHAVALNNREVRQRDECLYCDDEVPDEGFSAKYAGAGGVLAGPFCSSDCYWGWMNA